MIGGAAIPILYSFVIWFIYYVVQESIGWERLPDMLRTLLILPVGWIAMIHDKLFPSIAFDFKSLLESLLLTIIGNYILYFLLTYGFLHYYKIPRTENYTILH
jgi:hypothetical protein